MSIIEKARNLRKLIREVSLVIDDKTLVIATSEYCEKWAQGKYSVGDVRTSNGVPYECILDHDSTDNPAWDISVRTLWKPYHSRKKEYAMPWETPTGSHDMYLSGEYMIWTDGNIYQCLTDTSYSPLDYPQAWEFV